jgi:hypothetical protein
MPEGLFRERTAHVAAASAATGQEAWLVGGTVRDLAAGTLAEPFDVDVALTGDPVPFTRALAESTGGTYVPLAEDRGTVRAVAPDGTVYDVSTTGAFIETRGPLPVGAELQLEIIFGKESVRCTARVVRVQEPCWMHVGGVGVVFVEVDPPSRRVLEDFVHQSVVVAD